MSGENRRCSAPKMQRNTATEEGHEGAPAPALLMVKLEHAREEVSERSGGACESAGQTRERSSLAGPSWMTMNLSDVGRGADDRGVVGVTWRQAGSDDRTQAETGRGVRAYTVASGGRPAHEEA